MFPLRSSAKLADLADIRRHSYQSGRVQYIWPRRVAQ